MTLLIVAGFVLFVLAALGVSDAPRFKLGWSAAACVTLAFLIQHWPG